MSNAAALEITARAASIASHDEWVAFMSDERNITAFARQHVREEHIAAAKSGDYMDMSRIAGDVQFLLRLEVLTDEELVARYNDNIAAHEREMQHEDWSEVDPWDYEAYYHDQWMIEELRAFRDLAIRYGAHVAPLTQRPFAALAA